jgi:hypothetical protein
MQKEERESVTVNGKKYFLSSDWSLWTMTPRGQQLLRGGDAAAVEVLKKSRSETARRWLALVNAQAAPRRHREEVAKAQRGYDFDKSDPSSRETRQ